MRKIGIILFPISLLALLTACQTSHKIESTHEIKPVHIVIDVNLKVEKELDNYFDNIDSAEKKLETKTK
ncbi:MAG TPA: lipoprotein [Victivallales bacterium]|nr:lipoprotein [Victivallales bacterium]